MHVSTCKHSDETSSDIRVHKLTSFMLYASTDSTLKIAMFMPHTAIRMNNVQILANQSIRDTCIYSKILTNMQTCAM